MQKYIEMCLNLAKNSKDEVPVAAMLIRNKKIIAKAVNKKNKTNALAHAEILCIQKASKKLKRWNLNDCTMIVTLKPCKMCEMVIKESRINEVFYLINILPTKKGYEKTKFSELNDLKELQEEYRKILQNFFKNKRKRD